MIFRLMATVLVVSETGSVSLVSDHTDWPTQQACESVVQHIYNVPATSKVVGGFKMTVKMTASCVPVDVPLVLGPPPPLPVPPVALAVPPVEVVPPQQPVGRYGYHGRYIQPL
jgi:hypothetical protein